jgi:hypothetical protein
VRGDDHEQAIEELLQLWDAVDPDPVDVFEDRLAAELGLFRAPGCSRQEWRRIRVQYINTATEGEVVE